MRVPQKKILRLEISMSNTLLMAMMQSHYKLSKEVFSYPFIQLTCFLYEIKEFSSFSDLKNNKKYLFRLARCFNINILAMKNCLDDILMLANCLYCAEFVLKKLHLFWTEVFFHYFYCHFLISFRIIGQFDFATGSLPKCSLYPIFAYSSWIIDILVFHVFLNKILKF